MRMARSGLAFRTRDPLQGVSERVRRAVSQADLDAPHLLKLLRVCKQAKVTAESPTLQADAWAHVGLPAHKVVIYVREFNETARVAKQRASWERYGWKLIFV